MADEPITIRTDDAPPGRPRRPRSGRTATRPWRSWIRVVAVALVALGFWQIRRSLLRPPLPDPVSPAASQPVRSTPPPDATAAPPGASSPTPLREELAADDGTLLWASPTTGAAPAIDFAPDGTQLVLFWRPAQVAAHREWEKLAASLGPWGVDALAQLEQLTGCTLQEIDAAMHAVAVLDDRQPGVVHRIDLLAPWDAAELTRRFPEGVPYGAGPARGRQVGDRVCFLPAGGEGRVLVVCPLALASTLVSESRVAPALVRDVERLIGQSDAERSFTLVVAPRFLEAGGVALLTGSGVELRRGLNWLVRREATAALLSAHLNDDLFLELRATPTPAMPPRRLALQMLEQLREAPERIEAAFLAGDWPAYGRRVLVRFPSMLRQLAGYARVAAEQKTAVVRCYLPATAAHNLCMAAELMLTQQGVAAAPAGPADPTPQTLQQRLEQPVSLVFSKETLETALARLSETIRVPIEIVGRDLQLQGITKNQSLAIDLRNRPAIEILHEVLRRANPDRTASSLADPKQELVYVATGESEGAGRILVTTRTAAAQRAEELPAEFTRPPE